MGDPSQISKRFRKKSHKADETMHKSQPADVILVSLVEQKFLENRKKSYSRENLTLKLYIDRTFVKVWGKIDNAIPEKKTLYPNFEKLHQNFENVLSEFMYVLDVMYVQRKLLQVENSI